MFVCFGIGLLFSIAAHKGRGPEGSLLLTRHFMMSLAYLVFMGMGLALICYWIEPDWMWMYLVDRSKVSPIVTVFAFCFYPLVFCLGYLVAPQLDQARPGLAWQVYKWLNAAIVVVILIFIHRLWHVGAYEQYYGGQAPGLIRLWTPRMLLVGWVLILATPIVGGSLIWMYVKISGEAEAA